MLLHLHIEYFDMRVWFCVVSELAFDILVGTAFINRYVPGIFFSRKIMLRESRPVYISVLGSKERRINEPIVTNEVSTLTGNPSKKEIRLARQTVIPLRSESYVLILSAMGGLPLIESKPLPWEREQFIVAEGLVNNPPLLRFYVRVANVSTELVHLPKQMVMACDIEL